MADLETKIRLAEELLTRDTERAREAHEKLDALCDQIDSGEMSFDDALVEDDVREALEVGRQEREAADRLAYNRRVARRR